LLAESPVLPPPHAEKPAAMAINRGLVNNDGLLEFCTWRALEK
jgi:hypothetical protein